MRQCVCWLVREGVAPAAMTDPLEVMTLSKAEDPYHQQHAAVLEAWHDLYADRVVQVREIAKLVDGGVYGGARAERAFAELVAEIVPPRGGFNGKYFAGWLRRHKGRIVNSYRLDPGNPAQKEPGWRVTAQL